MKHPNRSTSYQDEELRQLYKKWPDIRRFLVTLGCKRNEAEDIFQEALLIYVRKLEQPDFVLTVDSFFYVRNTCKLLWYNQARREQKNPVFSLESDVEALNDNWFERERQLQTIERAMTKLGQQCRELLQLFYGLGWNMVDIAKKTGLRNDKVAKAQKYRCLQKAKELVRMGGQEETTVEPQNLYL